MNGVPVGLEFGPVLAMAAALQADVELVAEVLPEFEVAILSAMNADASED